MTSRTPRTIAVCPNCGYSWIVLDHPAQTSCGNCRTRHALDAVAATPVGALSDPDEARSLRGVVAARTNALTADNLPLDLDTLRDELNGAPNFATLEATDAQDTDRYTGHGSDKRSKRDVVLDAIALLDDPTLTEVAEYAEEIGVDGEEASDLAATFHDRGLIRYANRPRPGVSPRYTLVIEHDTSEVAD